MAGEEGRSRLRACRCISTGCQAQANPGLRVLKGTVRSRGPPSMHSSIVCGPNARGRTPRRHAGRAPGSPTKGVPGAPSVGQASGHRASSTWRCSRSSGALNTSLGPLGLTWRRATWRRGARELGLSVVCAGLNCWDTSIQLGPAGRAPARGSRSEERRMRAPNPVASCG